MNRRMMLWITLVTLVMLKSQVIVAQTSEPADLASGLAEFGEAFLPPVSNGLLILDGVYVPPPYTVGRKGVYIVINDKIVSGPLTVSSTGVPPVPEEDPGIPTNITKDSSFDDLNVSLTKDPWQTPLLRKTRFIIQNSHSDDERASELGKWFASLPFVTNVEHKGMHIFVYSRTGEKRGFGGWRTTAVPPKSKDEFRKELNGQHEQLARQLQSGGCVFKFSDGASQFIDAAKAKTLLPKLVASIDNLKTREEKMTFLVDSGLMDVSWTHIHGRFADMFKVTPELLQRLEELKKESPDGKQ